MLELAVDGHLGTEGSDVFGEFAVGVQTEAGGPVAESRLDGDVEPLQFEGRQLLGELHGGELRVPQDFVGISVADAAEDAGICESALEGVIFRLQGASEVGESGVEKFEASGVEGLQAFEALYEVKRGAFLRACLGPKERAVREIKGGETARATDFGAKGFPVKAAGDHQMEDEPEVVFESDADALAEAHEFGDLFAFGGSNGRVGGAEQRGRDDTNARDALAEDSALQGLDVDDDIGKLGHRG